MEASRTLLRSFSAASAFSWCHHTHRLKPDNTKRKRGSANCTKPGAGLESSLCTGEVGVALVEGPGTSTYGSGEVQVKSSRPPEAGEHQKGRPASSSGDKTTFQMLP